MATALAAQDNPDAHKTPAAHRKTHTQPKPAQQTSANASQSNSSNNSSTKPDPGLNAVVRDVLQHELRAQSEDNSLWCYRKIEEKDGKQLSFAACQTKAAEIDRLMAVNGKPLDAKQRREEDERLAKLLNSREQLRKQKQQKEEDGQQATNMLKMIPEAFLFQQIGTDGDRTKFKFTPNPKYRPSGNSAQVFHHMEGTLTLDMKQKRLVEISGLLNSDVKFGGGLLGHLDKGGTFYVKQQEVGSGYWEVTTLDVHMNGKALFFKTIAVRTKEISTDFHPVPPAATMQQVAALTNNDGDKNKDMMRAQK